MSDVNEFLPALIALVCMCTGIALGFALRAALNETVEEAKDIVGYGDSGVTGLVVLLSALVLGLLVASATDAFNDARTNVNESSAKISLSDQLLKDYGPQARPARLALCDAYAKRVEQLQSGSKEIVPRLPAVERQVRALTPQNADQTAIQTRVEGLIEDVRLTRRNVFEGSDTRVPTLLLGVLVFWLSAVFTAFALQSPRSVIALGVLLIGAVSAAGAIFLVEELNTPLDGLIKISTDPLLRTLAMMCK